MNDFKNLKKTNAEIEKAELRKHRLKNLDRKERAHRLIRKGAMLEKYFECEHLSPDETEELLKMYSNYINMNKPNKFKKKQLITSTNLGIPLEKDSNKLLKIVFKMLVFIML